MTDSFHEYDAYDACIPYKIYMFPKILSAAFHFYVTSSISEVLK